MLLKIILFLNLFILSSGTYGEEYKTKVNRIVDGDTIEIIVSEHTESLRKIHIRLVGIDTPEKRVNLAKCSKEIDLAKEAQQKLISLLPIGTEIVVKEIKYDKYGGRVLGVVFKNKLNVNQWMIEQNLAVAYSGVGVKHNWCD